MEAGFCKLRPYEILGSSRRTASPDDFPDAVFAAPCVATDLRGRKIFRGSGAGSCINRPPEPKGWLLRPATPHGEGSTLLLHLWVLDEYAPEDPGAPFVSLRPGLLAQAGTAPDVLRPVMCGPPVARWSRSLVSRADAGAISTERTRSRTRSPRLRRCSARHGGPR